MAEILIPVNDAITKITATGGQTALTYDFPIFDESHMVVERDRAGVVTTLVITTDYTVADVGELAGGTVTLVVGATNGDKFTLSRAVPVARSTDFQQAGDFRAATVNRELDLLTMMLQQHERNIGRSVRLATADETVALGELPANADRQDMLLGFSADGNGFTVDPKTGITGPTGPTGPAGADGVFTAIASQAEAEAGTENTKGMTALRSAQAIAALAPPAADQVARDMAATALALADAAGAPGQKGNFFLTDRFASDTLAVKTNATYDAAGDYYTNAGGDTLIGAGLGTVIKDGTWLRDANAFDGTTVQTGANSAVENSASNTVFRIGKDYGSGNEKTVTGMSVYEPNNTDFSNNNSLNLDFVLKASNTDPTTTGWTGDTIGTIPTFDPQPSAGGDIKSTLGNANATAYRYIWLDVAASVASGSFFFAEVEFFTTAAATNMTLAPTAATLDTANPTDLMAYFIFEQVDVAGFDLDGDGGAGDDVIATGSIDGGTTDAQGTFVKVGDLSATEELWRLDVDVSGQTGSSLIYEIVTQNATEVRLHDCVGVVPLY